MKPVFFDVDTQLDFLYPAGALSVPSGEQIVESLGKLTSFAAARGIQIISTADAHTEDDPEFEVWKPHCVAGTVGQQKAAATLLKKQFILTTGADALESNRSQVEGSPQIIVEKQKLDCFTNPNLRPLLKVMRADRYVVYGVVTEFCVRCAAFGLLETGAKVELVADAVKSLTLSAAREMMESFQAQGGKLTTVAEATA